jgi:hypothetical protein
MDNSLLIESNIISDSINLRIFESILFSQIYYHFENNHKGNKVTSDFILYLLLSFMITQNISHEIRRRMVTEK